MTKATQATAQPVQPVTTEQQSTPGFWDVIHGFYRSILNLLSAADAVTSGINRGANAFDSVMQVAEIAADTYAKEEALKAAKLLELAKLL